MATELSVVIPAFEEEDRLGPTLDRVLGFLRPPRWDAEVVVVDDGSHDRTSEVAIEAGKRHGRMVAVLRNPTNLGKGASVRRGVERTTRAHVLFTDADLSTPIEEVEKLLAAIESGFDVAIGSRAAAGAEVQVRQASYREWMGKIYNRMVRALSGLELRDTQCGFKLFRGEVAREVFREVAVAGFGFDVEALVRARDRGFRIAEVPVVWRNSPNSRVHPVRDSMRMAWDLMRIRWGRRGR